MGTRSTICEPHGDSYRGRYCHWDGYPNWMARQLWAIVKRDGLDTARVALLYKQTEWSSIIADPEDESLNRSRSQFRAFPGYGVHYDVQDDAWRGPDDIEEWAYVLADDGLEVIRNPWSGPAFRVGKYRWDEPEPDWQAVETSATTWRR